ncbi:MAG: stage III sporulation protein AE [Oscillospiraceae bacterium]|jgi:stage III sporulation protein AE|nr:stage III sporulation protein AE [Oscillospiraceae bacterium]
MIGKRRLRALLFAALGFALWAGAARAQALDEAMGLALGGVDFPALQGALDGMLSPGAAVDARDLVDNLAQGRYALDAGALLRRLAALLWDNIRDNAGLAALLLAPAVLCGVLAQMRAAFEEESVAQIAHYACFVLVCAPMIHNLVAQVNAARATADGMYAGMQALFPVLLTLLAAVGGNASSAFFQPAVIAAGGSMTAVVRDVTLNLALCCAAITVVNHLSSRVHLQRLGGLLRTVANWVLGVCFTVFIGVMTVQGMSVAAVDGVSIRTAKYVIDSFVPVVGGMFADTVDALVGCSLLVKNAVGLVGLMALTLYVAAPLAKLLATMLIYRLCAALLEPVADARVVACVGGFADVLMLVFITLLCMGVMFFLLIAQLLVVGNLTVMLR